MNKRNLILVISGCVVFLVVISYIIYIVTSNKEIELRTLVLGQQKTCEANYDKMFKVITQTAEIAEANMDASKKAFKEIYPALMEGRYGNERGGALWSFINEANPQFDLNATSKLYEKVAEAVEINRSEFFMEQKKLIDYQREHKNTLLKFPGSLLLSRDTIDIKIITSAKTKEVYRTGEENNIELFHNQKDK